VWRGGDVGGGGVGENGPMRTFIAVLDAAAQLPQSGRHTLQLSRSPIDDVTQSLKQWSEGTAINFTTIGADNLARKLSFSIFT